MRQTLKNGKTLATVARGRYFAKFRTHLKITGSKFRDDLKNLSSRCIWHWLKKKSKLLIKGKKIILSGVLEAVNYFQTNSLLAQWRGLT